MRKMLPSLFIAVFATVWGGGVGYWLHKNFSPPSYTSQAQAVQVSIGNEGQVFGNVLVTNPSGIREWVSLGTPLGHSEGNIHRGDDVCVVRNPNLGWKAYTTSHCC
jgi:hypothetical protein